MNMLKEVTIKTTNRHEHFVFTQIVMFKIGSLLMKIALLSP